MSTSLFLKKYLFARFLIVVAILQVSRVLFFIFNREMFLSDNNEIARTFLKSILFDFLSTLLYFTPYICLILLFLLFKTISKWHRLFLTLYFSILFWFVTIVSFVDIYYYKFNLRRINLEALQLIHDAHASIYNFALHNPSSIVLLFLLIGIFIISIYKTSIFHHNVQPTIAKKNVIIYLSIFISTISIILWQFAKYFSPLSSSLIVAPGYTGLYTNSPQAFIYSFRSGWTYVKPLHYFSDEEADQLVPVFYANNPNVTPNKRNIVLFILESFSYSYLDINNPNKPSTPFFDSLIQHSTFFTNAYANNTTSANGLCSILSGIPSLINQPFFSSAYAGNPINAIALALNKNAYETSFFLGANDDHFGFKKGTKLLGIQHYYNGEAFPASQHDGTWGIYDEPFLQYFAQESNHIQQPFFSVFFTISSHYPFKIPDALLNKFGSKKNHDNERAVSYVDYAFRNYFNSIKNTDWFQNTIFIFTGDHVSKENKKERVLFNFNSYYHIPIFIFDPQKPNPVTITNLVQHTDIPATVAYLTQIKDTILSFGQPFEDTTKYHYTINRYSENIVQMIDTNTLIQYDIINNKMLDIYRIDANDQLTKVTDENEIKKIENKSLPLLKAYMQQYFNRLYYNKLYKK